MPLKIGIVVGESSGDILAANLIALLRENYPELEVEGVVGPELLKQSAVQLYPMDTLSVMGFIEPLRRLPQLLRMRKWLAEYFLADPPDVFIGVDAPDFNLGLEKILKRANVPTVHYVSPSVWAWRRGRLKTIKQAVDLMLTLFPFEAKFYEKFQIPVCFTGHPTADKIPFVIDQSAAKKYLNYLPDDKVVGILPGSRVGELKYMLQLYLLTAKLCFAENPKLKFVIPIVHSAYEEFVVLKHQEIAPEIPLQVVIEDSYAVMRAVDVALVTSGTATLELMLHKKPMVVGYKTNWLTYHIVKLLIEVQYIALPNLLADKLLVPEYIQGAATPKQLAAALLELLGSTEVCQLQLREFEEIHKLLKQGANERASVAIRELIGV